MEKRNFMGRPYVFCKECDKKKNCSLDYPCEQRDQILAKKQSAQLTLGDDRFWKNGVPRKKLVLCQSAKYKYAHKRTAGQCQREKCRFYSNGTCDIGLNNLNIDAIHEESTLQEQEEIQIPDKAVTEMSESEQIEEAKKCLLVLKDELEKIKKLNEKAFNVFNAVGMQTQEIKHSAFLAWLLNPQKPENMKFDFLSEFLKDLYEYSSNEIVNSEIIGTTTSFKSKEEFSDIAQASDIKVIREYSLTDGEDDGRIDIYLEIPQSKTIIIIENKTFTTSHDDQLNRYIKEFKNKKDFNQIFIYLTPKGDLPTEEHKNWCLYSYERINAVLSAMISDVQNKKLKYLIGDYIDMVDMNIIKGNKELKGLCKQIRREHKEALAILLEYTDNIEEVQAYCVDWFIRNIPNITLKSGKTTFEFYTETMKKVFDTDGNDINTNVTNLWKLRCVFGYGENVPISISLQKNIDEEWDNTQTKIIEYFAPHKKKGNKYFSINEFSTELLTVEERNKDFESVKPLLDQRLLDFAKQLQKFDNVLKTL